jgi:hypothetical protein
MLPPPRNTRLLTAAASLWLACLQLLQFLQRAVVRQLRALPLLGYKVVRLAEYTALVRQMGETWRSLSLEVPEQARPSELPELRPERRLRLSWRLSVRYPTRRTLRRWPPRRHWRRPGLAGQSSQAVDPTLPHQS